MYEYIFFLKKGEVIQQKKLIEKQARTHQRKRRIKGGIESVVQLELVWHYLK